MRFRAASKVNENESILGYLIHDWQEYGFELIFDSCELRCLSLKTLDSPYKSIGFVQSHTRVSRGPTIQTADRDTETLEKLNLHTMELQFQRDDSMFSKILILGHPDEAERDRWLLNIQLLAERKAELERGWQSFTSSRLVSDREKAEHWIRTKLGEVDTHVNEKARRKARLQNGKVLHDLPRIFDAHSEDCPSWPRCPEDDPAAPPPRAMRVSKVAAALAELGLELPPRLAGRLLEELRGAPQCEDLPEWLERGRFEQVFHSCRRELLVSPSAAMKQSLLRIMQTSENPFLRLLSPAEHMFLIDGRDAAGNNACVCRSYPRGTALVRQGDPGDSMFLILDGRISVVVAFGVGAAATIREVAQLHEGAVMGEMSLVLGRSGPHSPRRSCCHRQSKLFPLSVSIAVEVNS